MHRDRLAIESPCRRLVYGRRSFHMWKRNQDDPAGLRFECGRHEISEPTSVGLREEALRTRRKQTACKMYDHVHPGDRGRQCRWMAEIRSDRTNVRSMHDIVRQRAAMVHQPKFVPGRYQVTRKQTTEVPCGAGDQDGASVFHGHASPADADNVRLHLAIHRLTPESLGDRFRRDIRGFVKPKRGARFDLIS